MASFKEDNLIPTPNIYPINRVSLLLRLNGILVAYMNLSHVPQNMDVLRTLLDNLEEALIILDPEGKILLFNEVAAKLSKSLLVKPFQEGTLLCDSMDHEMSLVVRDLIHEVHSKKTAEKHFAEFRNSNHSLTSLEFNFVPVINSQGIETHIHLLIRDISFQKNFEKKLVTQASNITNLIEKASAVIIGLDTRGYVTDWNESSTTVTEFTKNDVYAQKFADVVMKDVAHEKFAWILEKVLKRESVVNQELLIRTQPGNLITLLLSATPRLSQSNQVVGWSLVGQDVTELTEYRMSLEMKVEERTRELKRALQKEQEVVEMKTRFVAIASHEFRSPLSSIQFQTNFIKRNADITPGDLQKRLDTIEQQVGRMSTLLDDVLKYGKSDAPRIKLDISSIVLADFLSNVVEEVSHFARRGNHFIRADYANIPTTINSDEALLRSILINLLTNAIKFSPGKEWVYLTVKGSASQLIITIRDEGIGIPPNEINEIFEPFLRGKSAASIQGTGLGLSIVKKSVELLGGIIQTTSEPCKGTTFTVIIPILPD